MTEMDDPELWELDNRAALASKELLLAKHKGRPSEELLKLEEDFRKIKEEIQNRERMRKKQP